MQIQYTNYHPEICKILKTLEELKDMAQYRANILVSREYPNETDEERDLRRGKSQSTVDAYAFCQRLLMDAKI